MIKYQSNKYAVNALDKEIIMDNIHNKITPEFLYGIVLESVSYYDAIEVIRLLVSGKGDSEETISKAWSVLDKVGLQVEKSRYEEDGEKPQRSRLAELTYEFLKMEPCAARITYPHYCVDCENGCNWYRTMVAVAAELKEIEKEENH